ncbi:MAG: GAF domain-containing protein, partial [Gammaproteobacteria bacterium]|nr:GAF domain-containing protein [Gammaproteobacteria bacterium]
MKLNRKILLVTISVLFISLVISSVVNIISFQKNYTEALITGSIGLGQSLNSIVREMLDLGLPLDSLAGMDKKLKQLVIDNPHISYAAIADLDGRAIHHSNTTLVGEIFTDKVMQRSLATDIPLTQIYHRFDGLTYYDVTLPIFDSSHAHFGVVRLGFLTQVVNDKVLEAIIQVVVNFTLSFLIIAFLINFLLSRMVSKPVIALSDRAQNIANGKFDSLTSMAGNDEISQLSASLNDMAMTIKSQLDALNRSRNDLERDVQERTSALEDANTNLQKINDELLKAIKLKDELTARESLRSHILEIIASDVPLSKVLETIVLSVEREHPAMLCSILLMDRSGKHLRHGASPSLPDFYNTAIDGLEIGIGVGSCGTAAFTAKRVIVNDIPSHPYWAAYKELAARAELGACWSQPIYSASGQVLGTFAIYHHEAHTPDAADIEIIEQSANLASIAIDRDTNLHALQQSQSELQEAQRIGHMGNWQLDVASNRIIWSEELSLMQGLDPKTAPPNLTECEKLFTPDSWQRLSSAISRTLASGEPYDLELEMVKPDGSHGWMHGRGEAVRDASGAIMTLRGTATDITQRKQAEATLQKKERYQRALLDNFPFAVWLKDTESRFLSVNSGFVNLFGASHSCDELVGQNDFDIASRKLAEAYRADDRAVMASREK